MSEDPGCIHLRRGCSPSPRGTAALAGRIWTTDAVPSTATHRSHALVGSELAERVFAGWVPRPVLTVARKRRLQERRVPIGEERLELFLADTTGRNHYQTVVESLEEMRDLGFGDELEAFKSRPRHFEADPNT